MAFNFDAPRTEIEYGFSQEELRKPPFISLGTLSTDPDTFVHIPITAINISDPDPIFRNRVTRSHFERTDLEPTQLGDVNIAEAIDKLGSRQVIIERFDLRIKDKGILLPPELLPVRSLFTTAGEIITGLTAKDLEDGENLQLSLRRKIVILPNRPDGFALHCDGSAKIRPDGTIEPPLVDIAIAAGSLVGSHFYPSISLSAIQSVNENSGDLESLRDSATKTTLTQPNRWLAFTNFHAHSSPYLTNDDVPAADRIPFVEYEIKEDGQKKPVRDGYAVIRRFFLLGYRQHSR